MMMTMMMITTITEEEEEEEEDSLMTYSTMINSCTYSIFRIALLFLFCY
jgi:hypothetical protein